MFLVPETVFRGIRSRTVWPGVKVIMNCRFKKVIGMQGLFIICWEEQDLEPSLPVL